METQNHKKPFYKKWWGIILVLIFWPILVPYMLWDLDKWHLNNKKANKPFTKKEMIAPYVIFSILLFVIAFNILPETKQEKIDKENQKQAQILQGQKETEDKAKKERETDSIVFAESIIKKILKAPSTANFVDVRAFELLSEKDVWSVSGYVDSQNSFGAMIRSQWEVQLDWSDGKGGTVKSIFFDGKKIQ